MKGTSSTTFAPTESLNRAMVATILHRLDGTPSVKYQKIFTDVPDNTWYTNGVIWAYQNEIVNGYGNGLFGPNDNITREQLAVMMYRYASYKNYDVRKKAELDDFEDNNQVSSWAEDAMEWAVGNGIINGRTNTKLDPHGHANRAECAAIITRFLELYK